MIIWIASYPRSGNNLFSSLIKYHLRFTVYSVYNEGVALHEYLDHEALLDAAQSQELFFVKTHELPEDDFPAIYIVRDGRDVVISYMHYILDTGANPPGLQSNDFYDWAMDTLINTTDQFGGWGAHIQAWTNRKAPTVVVRFEELIQKDKQFDIFKSTLSALGLGQLAILNSTPLPDFKGFHIMEPALFRKGKSGSWATEMSLMHHLKFWEKYGDAMEILGYKQNDERGELRIEFVLGELAQSFNDTMGKISNIFTDSNTLYEENRRLVEELREAQVRLNTLEEKKDQELREAQVRLNDLEKIKNQELSEKEQVIQSFRNSFSYTLTHGPFRRIPLMARLQRTIGWILRPIRGAHSKE